MAQAVAIPDLSEFNDTSGLAVSDELEAELLGGNARAAKRFQHCYWRRPDGWITVAPNYGDERDFQIERGMEPLRKYGTFQLHTRQWDAFIEPWRQLFMRGGAGEFPLAQILENGWHRRSPYQLNGEDIHFPQLVGIDLSEYTFECAICKKVLLSEHDLSRHQSIAHKETSHENALGRAIGNAIEAAQAANNNALAQALMVLAEQSKAQNEQMAEMVKQLADRKK